MDRSPGESLAFKKGNKELVKEFDIAFDEVLKNGEYIELVKKYFPDKVDQNIIK